MLGVILCTHSNLAQGFKDAVEMIAGEQENFEVICFMNGDDLDGLKEKIENHINFFASQGMPSCVLVDLYAATPFNISLALSMEHEVDVICGVNLPILLEVLLSRDSINTTNFHDSLDLIINQSTNSIKLLNGKDLL